MAETPLPSDNEFCPTAEDLYMALMDLMPPGVAWDTQEAKPASQRDTVIRQFIYGLAATWVKLEEEYCAALNEWFCLSSSIDKDAWERDYGIPGECELFNADVCAKVLASVNIDAETLLASLASLGYAAEGRWLTGNDPEFPGVRSTFRVVIDPDLSPALHPQTELDFPVGSELGYSAGVSGAACALEAVIPAHCVVDLFTGGTFSPITSLGSLLKLWYSADTTANGPVASLAAFHGGPLALTAAGAAQPSSALRDGFRFIEFDGVDDALTSAANPAIAATSELMVFGRTDSGPAIERTAISAFGGQRQLGTMGLTNPPTRSLLDGLTEIGALTGLTLCLDAGDILSYAGGGAQSWVDRVGVADNVWLGSTSGVTVNDPTFNGVPGNLSVNEVFSYDGADWCLSAAQPAWAQTFHKAGAQYTLATLVKFAAIGSLQTMFGTGTPAETGIRYAVAANGLAALAVHNAGVQVANTQSSGMPVPVGTWVVIGISVDAVAGRAVHLVGRNTLDVALPFNNPATADATRTLQMGAIGAGTPFSAGTQVAQAAVWTRAMTAVEFKAVAEEMLRRVETPITPRLRIRAQGGSGPVLLTGTQADASGLVALTDHSVAASLQGRIAGQPSNPASVPITGFAPPPGILKLGGGQGFWKGGIRHAFVTDTLTPSQRMQLEAWAYWDVGRPDLLPDNHLYRLLKP